MRNAKESSLAELRPPRLHSLTGLKVIALILIFIWHALPQEGLPDLGARCCEVMFASSGFLVAYNRHDRFGATLDSALDYLRNKIKAFYPVYLTSLLATILYLVLSNHGMMWVTKESIASLTWHILLLQAWFPAISMQYNGLAWFLSALLFCYATAPFMSVIVKKICGWLEDRKWIGYLATFIMLAGIRWYIEWCNHLNGSEYPMSLYVNPVLRCLEFSMAYVVGAWYSSQGIEIVRRASRCHILAGGGVLKSLLSSPTFGL